MWIHPFTQSNLFPKLILFFHVETHKVYTCIRGGFTFYYTSHVIKRFIPHVHRAQPLNGFEIGSNLAENRIEYVLLTSWDGISIFSSANRARPGPQKLPSNGFTEWNFLRNKEKAYIRIGDKFDWVAGVRWGWVFFKQIRSPKECPQGSAGLAKVL